MNPASARHAADFLRATDRDRYFATLMLKPELRPAVQALYEQDGFDIDVFDHEETVFGLT